MTIGGARRRHVYLLTLTAPSQHPHSMYVPGRRGRHGDCPCWRPDLDRWNGQQSKCWNRLRTWLVREHPSLSYFRAVEVQDRGALHLHVLLILDELVDLVELHAAALAAGFGCVLDLEPLEPGSRNAARYVSKYVTKACDQRDQVPWLDEVVDRETGEIKERRCAAYRTWSSSQCWGLKMREVVAASRRAVQARQSLQVAAGHQEGPERRPPHAAPARAPDARPPG